MGKKAEDPIFLSTEEVKKAQRSAVRLRHLLKRRRTLVHSIKVEGDEQPFELPAGALEVLADAVEEIAKGHAVRITSQEEELSTQTAAGLLNVSRPYLIGLLGKGEIPFRKVGTHRRLRLSDVLAYKARSETHAKKAFDELVAQAQKLGMGYE